MYWTFVIVRDICCYDKHFIRRTHREQIGSVKGPKNFSSDQTVFHRDDVPAARRERKKEVKEVSVIPLMSHAYRTTSTAVLH